MGSLIQNWKTIPLPEGAKVGRDGAVTWIVRGKKKTGKLSGTGKVTVQVDVWTAQFTDETGKVQRISTKTKDRSIAAKILAQKEAEVDRIRAGIATREELDKAQAPRIALEEVLTIDKGNYSFFLWLIHYGYKKTRRGLATGSTGNNCVGDQTDVCIVSAIYRTVNRANRHCELFRLQ